MQGEMFQIMAYSRGFVNRFPDLVPRKEVPEEIDSSDDEDVLAKESPARAPRVRYVSPPAEEEEDECERSVTPELPRRRELSVTPELPKKIRTMRPSTEKKRIRGKK